MHIEIALIIMVLVAAISDIRSRRIPNALVVCGLFIALILQTSLPIAGSFQTWLLGALTGFFLVVPFYLVRGMGAGDVKLMAAVGSFVGPSTALKIVVATFIVGGIWSLLVIVSKGKVRETCVNLRALIMPLLMRRADIAAQAASMPYQSVGRIPYGVAIALGTLIALFLGRG